MQRVKRSRFITLILEDRRTLDVGAFLRGEGLLEDDVTVVAYSALSEATQELAQAEVKLLSSCSSTSWTSASQLTAQYEVASERITTLISEGFLISDGATPETARLRRREEQLTSNHWQPEAAYYHFASRQVQSQSRSSDIETLSANAELDAKAFVDSHGPPPAPFHRPGATEGSFALPKCEAAGTFYTVLKNRRTTRAFDSVQPLELKDLATLLYFVFGCHGIAELSEEVTLLHKTSPSGGSLHPIEAYPLVLNVDGLKRGLYHYNTESHSLGRLKLLGAEEATELAIAASAGQDYAGAANVLIIMTARFGRNQWKYRQQSRTYAVMLMDAGHLSQTLYLVATELGLGAFFTGAIEGPLIESTLGLNAAEEGAVAVCGVGRRPNDGAEMGLDFKPFVPLP